MACPMRRFLVCRSDALGDAILALPVCQAIKHAWPLARISLLVSRYACDAVEGQRGPDVVLAYDAPGQHAGWQGFNRLVHELKAQCCDVALLLFPDPRISLAVRWAGIPLRIGTSRRLWSFLYNVQIPHSRQKADRHEADYNLDLVRILGKPVILKPPRLRLDAQAQAWAIDYWQKLKLKSKDALVILHPGGRGSAANWPAATYGALADILIRRYYLKVLLTGSADEQPLLQQVADQTKQPIFILKEPISLKQLMALIARAQVFVSGNTGPMHLAAGLDVPLVAIFPSTGVTGPTRWGPLSQQAVVMTTSDPEMALDSRGSYSLTPTAVAEKVDDLLKHSLRSR